MPRFVLGAMLPDFASMCGVRMRGVVVSDEGVAAGVGCHHRADAAFHDSAHFLALCRQAREALYEAGVRRPTAMAAAHVGVELLLDGCWLEQPEVDAAYLAALDASLRLPIDAIAWDLPAHAERFARLCVHLKQTGSARAYRDPEQVGRRLVQILGRRPRLAPAEGDHARLVQWAHRARPRVAAVAAALREELRQVLGQAPAAEAPAR